MIAVVQVIGGRMVRVEERGELKGMLQNCYFFSSIYIIINKIGMKVMSPNQFALQKASKPNEIIFRTNRSYDKFAHPSISKTNTPTQNREPTIPFLINSLHSYLNEDKPLPKLCARKAIQILGQLLNKNNSFENFKVINEKTPDKLSNIAKRQFTEDATENPVFERSNERRDTTRIRKIRTKKMLESTATQLKDNEWLEQQNILAKRITELEDKIEHLKSALECKDAELMVKDQLITKLEQQRENYTSSLTQLLRQNHQNQANLRAAIEHKTDDLREAMLRVNVLKTQLVERQAEIVSYWSFAIRKVE